VNEDYIVGFFVNNVLNGECQLIRKDGEPSNLLYENGILKL
jgi:hypothetical protein